ncbi:MAG: alpha-2-macroglobulin family protein, partial [Bacteroidota bacterium]
EEVLLQQWVKPGKKLVVDRKVLEADRGGFAFQFAYAGLNRATYERGRIMVPWDNKDLDIEYLSFRDKLEPGQEETWEIKIKGPKGDLVAAELLASMYDASLDQFAKHSWSFREFPSRSSTTQTLSTKGFASVTGRVLQNRYASYVNVDALQYPQFLDFGFNGYGYYGGQVLLETVVSGVSVRSSRSNKRAKTEAAPLMAGGAPEADMAAPQTYTQGNLAPPPPPPPPPGEAPSEDPSSGEEGKPAGPAVRENLNETVFFFPDLKTDAEGNVRIQFKMNEALTRWKFLIFGLTEELQTVIDTKEVITQKDLMVIPNPPRFYRERDEIVFTSKVVNLSEEALSGEAWLELENPLNGEAILAQKENARQVIELAAGASVVVKWPFNVPDVQNVPVIQHTVYASAGRLTDAERAAAPVLTNRMLVTEALPLPVRGASEKTFTLQSMANNTSKTLSHEAITLEFTSNPAWYAVQALPYLMEYPYECSEQIFSRYYANSLATSVANAHPRIKSVFEAWKGTPALESNLSKNEELKSALLTETPWVLNAQSEAAQKRNIGLLFDLNRMAREQQIALDKLSDRQLGNGGFPWFPGGRDNWYISQYIVEGLGHLNQLGVSDIRDNANAWRMTKEAVQYIDQKLVEHYEDLARQVRKGFRKWDDDNLDYMVVHYLYARSFFLQEKQAQASQAGGSAELPTTFLALNAATQKAVDYYLGQADEHWLQKGYYGQGMLGLALHRMKRLETPTKITASLKERALNNEELGIYWKYGSGFFWYQHPIETQSLLIELFAEVAQDADMVEGMKIWLLKNKQTQHWRTTKATASAVYALLSNGDNWLLESAPVDITLGTQQNEITSQWQAKIVQAQAGGEAGTGYFKVRFDGSEVRPEMAQVTVKNPNKGVAWGGLYWQYFEDLDKIETFEETPLTLKKQVFLVENSPGGERLTELADQATLKPGDKLKVRIELRVDRAMEYVHMKDMRASGFEPINVLSSYKWQGGLGYYESTKDASTDFFFGYLPKGTHVFEYPLRVNLSGDFSNGVTTIQCMYAPEFTSHSEGIRLRVD